MGVTSPKGKARKPRSRSGQRRRVRAPRLRREHDETRARCGSICWSASAADLTRTRVRGRIGRSVPARLRRGRGDVALLMAVGILVTTGIVMVLDVSYFYSRHLYDDPFIFFRKHLLSVAIGTAALVLASSLSLPAYRRMAIPAIAAAIVGAVIVLSPLGTVIGGAKRWLAVGGVHVQPSEVVKLAVVVYLAWWCSRHRDRLAGPWPGLAPPFVVVGIVAALVLAEPDLGTAVLLEAVLMGMMFVAGVPPRRMRLILMGGIAAAVVGIAIAPYRIERVRTFLDPWRDPHGAGFQLVQSLITFSSGGLTGLGLGESRQKMFYLPAAHTDFIFAVIAEELGLLGALALIALFIVVAWRGSRIVLRHADPFGRLLACGVTVTLTMQALVNMAVVLGLLPTKGLPLPFVSYGGSAMVAALASVGILYGLSRETG